jgi:hypothetical protein
MQIEAMRKEKSLLEKTLLLDTILGNRAEIHVLSQEIERGLISSAVRALDSET